MSDYIISFCHFVVSKYCFIFMLSIRTKDYESIWEHLGEIILSLKISPAASPSTQSSNMPTCQTQITDSRTVLGLHSDIHSQLWHRQLDLSPLLKCSLQNVTWIWVLLHIIINIYSKNPTYAFLLSFLFSVNCQLRFIKCCLSSVTTTDYFMMHNNHYIRSCQCLCLLVINLISLKQFHLLSI